MRGLVDARDLEGMLGELAWRGYDIHLMAESSASAIDDLAERLARDYPAIRCRTTPARPFDALTFLGREMRRALEAVDQAERSAGAAVRSGGGAQDGHLDEGEAVGLVGYVRRGRLFKSPGGRWLLQRLLRSSERAIPVDPHVRELMTNERPGLVLAVPAEGSGLRGVEYLRGARAMGVRAGFCGPRSTVAAAQRVLHEPVDVVMSWDSDGPELAVQTSSGIETLDSCVRSGGRRPVRGPWWAPLARPLLSRAAARLARTGPARRQMAVSQRELESQRDADRLVRRAEVAVVKRKAAADAAVRRERERALAEVDRQARLATAARTYEHYRCVRTWAGRMRDSVGEGALTVTHARSRADLGQLWDATPEMIGELRRWCEPVSGVRVADYEMTTCELADRLRRELVPLWKQVGRELFVPEASILGGFGFSVRGELHNQDTVAFFKVLVALQDGAVLPAFRGSPRRLVWEVDGGWGGFAYQFKTVCPNVTYLITSSPEQFLLSAVYLMAAFPDARCRFYDPASPGDLWHEWEQVDFVFAPESALPLLRPPQLDLMLDLLALSRMSSERASAHVGHAFELAAPYLYSLLPDGTAAEVSAATVDAISRYYWPHPIPSRPVSGRSGTLDTESEPVPAQGPAHLVGWRRLRP